MVNGQLNESCKTITINRFSEDYIADRYTIKLTNSSTAVWLYKQKAVNNF